MNNLKVSKWMPTWLGIAAMVCGMSVALTPSDAAACGGTFCDPDAPSGPMPVDQTGENVIFVMGGNEIEVHIQISVDPESDAEKFGWLVPLAAVPEFSVGSQPLFDAILAASVPRYDLTTTFELCGNIETGGDSASDSNDPTNFTSGMASESDSDDTEGPGPSILKEETVGAFQIVVLTDKTVEPIRDWLIDNGYAWDESAHEILQEYLQEGNVIAALKLAGGAGLEDVHPITLRYPSTETCFPLRLTRIAAVENMDIRVFVLGESRAVPTNYRHVLVNPLKIDWLQFANNYKEVITNAVDAFMADGRAFVTEYAGPSNIVDTTQIYNPSWDASEFMGLDPIWVTVRLNGQGLAACASAENCAWRHPLVFGMLLEYLPAPEGLEPAEFYAALGTYADQIDLDKWGDGSGFADAMQTRIIDPGLHGEALINTWPYLTRMYTTISPNEMTEDPIFHQNPDLGQVANIRTAQNFILCNGDSVVTLPDDREFYIPNGGPWPQIPGEEWFAESVETVALKGAPMTLVNNTAAIDAKLIEWNLSHGWPRMPGDTDSGDTVPTTSDTNVSDPGTDSGSGSSSSSSSSGPDTAGQTDDGGCGCRHDSAPGALWLGLSVLGLVGLRRRKAV